MREWGSSLRLALSIFKQELNGDLTTSFQCRVISISRGNRSWIPAKAGIQKNGTAEDLSRFIEKIQRLDVDKAVLFQKMTIGQFLS